MVPKSSKKMFLKKLAIEKRLPFVADSGMVIVIFLSFDSKMLF
jgi:hypothetical protein